MGNKILSGKLSFAGIKAEKLLEVNQNRANLTKRSLGKSIFDRSINRTEYHNEKLSILRRHKDLIKELLGEAEYSEILYMSVKEQKQQGSRYSRDPRRPRYPNNC